MHWLRSTWARRAGLALALALLILATMVAAREVEPARLLHADPAHLLGLIALVAGNIVLTGLLIWAITRSFDANPPVRPLRMIELIAVSGLLNYLPLIRAGLVGRAAYLKARHGLPIRQSLVIMVIVGVLTLLAGSAALLVLLPAGVGTAAMAAAVAALTLVTPAVGRVLRRPVRLWALWVPLRILDLFIAAARLWLAFVIVGHPIGFDASLVAAAAGLVVKVAGLTPNGLGLSEWAVAGLAAALAPVSAAEGAAAALVDRGAEVMVVTVLGLLAAWRLRSDLPPAAGDHPRRCAPSDPGTHPPASAGPR